MNNALKALADALDVTYEAADEWLYGGDDLNAYRWVRDQLITRVFNGDAEKYDQYDVDCILVQHIADFYQLDFDELMADY